MFLLLLSVFATYYGAAQIGAMDGTIQGVVEDQQGKRVPDAAVTIRSGENNAERVLHADRDGAFSTALLPAGAYTVEAHTAQLVMRKPVALNLNVGGSVLLHLRLFPANVSQSIKVTGKRVLVEGNTVMPAVNRQQMSTANWIAGLTVTYLPDRDRDFSQFSQLAAMVASNATGTGLIVSGQRPNALAITLDGGPFTNELEGGALGARSGAFVFPQTVVREMQIVHSGVSADVGGTNAGVVNIATKSGSDKFHGEALYIGRPATLSSSDAFGHSLDTQQNEFGGSFGRSIRRRRAYFYTGFEQDFLHQPYWTQFGAQSAGTKIPTNLADLQTETIGNSNATALFGKIDALLNQSNTLTLEYAYNRFANPFVGDGFTRSLASPEHADSLKALGHWFRADLTSAWNGHNVNQVAVEWSHDSQSNLPVSNSPEVVINGFGVLGGDGLSPHVFVSSLRQVEDAWTTSFGKQSFTFGGDIASLPGREDHEENLNGRFDFNSLADYLAGQPRRFQQTFVTGHGVYDEAVHHGALYAMDQISLPKALTIHAGLRWDAQWNPQPHTSNPSVSATASIPNDLLQFQPRAGIAWSPLPATTIRIFSGLYDAPTPADIFARVFTDNGMQTIVVDSYFNPQVLPQFGIPANTSHGFAVPPAGSTIPQPLVVGIAPGFRNPRSFEASSSIEQALPHALDLTLGYQRNSTWDLPWRLDENLFPPVSGPYGMPTFPTTRPNPALGRVEINQSSAHSSYDGMFVSAAMPFRYRSEIVANYTLSRTRDNDSSIGPFSRDSALNPFDLGAERAYSSFDIRQMFNLNAIVNLPVGFKLNPILVSQSGLPYTPLIGFDTQHDANDWNDRAVLHGVVSPRNIGRGPAFNDLDLRLVKDITLKGKGHHLDLFMDAFNVLGAPNRSFGADQVSIYGATGAFFPTAGQPLYAPASTRFGSARQIQFTARIVAF